MKLRFSVRCVTFELSGGRRPAYMGQDSAQLEIEEKEKKENGLRTEKGKKREGCGSSLLGFGPVGLFFFILR